MITYIINTSENKTFDSENLFSLVGYSKIVWMTCRLDNIKKCAMEIYEKQNALGVDRFRVAVIVDFFNFDKIRHPYGEDGYKKDKENVDIAIYFPFIESFLVDNLFDVLMRKHLFIEQKDIFYVQNCALGAIDNISNAEEQVKIILTPTKLSDEQIEQRKKNLDLNDEKNLELQRSQSIERGKQKIKNNIKAQVKIKLDDLENAYDNGRISLETHKEECEIVELKAKEQEEKEVQLLIDSYKTYCQFDLHCTELMNLTFDTTDYPYGGSEFVTYNEFYSALISRNVQNKQIKRHYYYNPNSTTKIMAAYDTLTLCLYLIEMYEQEETMHSEGEMKIKNIKPERLRDVLVKSWNKVCRAQESARENKIKYYDVKKILEEVMPNFISTTNLEDKSLDFERKVELRDYNYSIEEAYENINTYASHTEVGMSQDDLDKLNIIISAYLDKRDANREELVDEEFDSEIKNGNYETEKSPSKVMYDKLLRDKEKEISNIFKDTLKSEYISMDYKDEKKQADELYMKYIKLSEYRKGKPLATIIFCVLTTLIMLIPYMLLQRKFAGLFSLESIILYLVHIGVVVGTLFLSFLILDFSYKLRISRLRKNMYKCLFVCEEKNRLSMSKFKERYEHQLLAIENARYVIRQINRIYKLNAQIEKHIKIHRIELEMLENHLSAILNNLGIEPVVDKSINIKNEFDIKLPIDSPQNKVYKIFSIEVIEELFSSNGGEQ